MSGVVWAIWMIVVLLIAYLLGSIPTGYLMGRATKGIDIRQFGSGSTGATNVLRTLGKGPALVVLLIDVLKGSLSVIVTRWIYAARIAPVPPMSSPADWIPWIVILAGLIALIGHSRSIWLRFGGGKSVASGLGVLLAMHWPSAIVAILIFVSVLAISRIVSFSSITTAVAVPVLMLTMHQPLPFLLFAIAAAAYIVLRHRTNIQRIFAGTEPRIGQKLEQPSSKSAG
jgi:glycerol-3-phosphate acyltransferase PlsY